MKGKERTQEPRIIKNRDIPLLSRVLCVMQDVCSLEKRCEWQRDRLFSITQHIHGKPGRERCAIGFDAAFAAIDGINEDTGNRLPPTREN